MRNALKWLRQMKGLTQGKAAQIIGVARENYSKKETGKIEFTLSQAKALANYFGLSIEQVFYSEGSEVPDTMLAIYCMTRHAAFLFKQTAAEQKADYYEACSNCPMLSICEVSPEKLHDIAAGISGYPVRFEDLYQINRVPSYGFEAQKTEKASRTTDPPSKGNEG